MRWRVCVLSAVALGGCADLSFRLPSVNLGGVAPSDAVEIDQSSVPVVRPMTETVAARGRLTDAAVWANAEAPAESRILAVGGGDGIAVHTLSGEAQGTIEVGAPVAIDIARMADGSAYALTANADGSISLVDMAAGTEQVRFPTGHRGATGICMAGGEQPRVAVTHEDPRVDIYALEMGAMTDLRLLSSFELENGASGCAFDMGNDRLILSEPQRGLVAFNLPGLLGSEPVTGPVIDHVGSASSLVGPISDIALYETGTRSGYVVAVSRGNNRFMVYDRETYAFLGRFTIAGGDGIDDVEQTSGIGVTSAPLGEAYPTGALIIHDADNDGGENLKYVPWRTVTRRLGLM